MTKLQWDRSRPHQVGLDNGVLYFGVNTYAWNGLLALDENPEAADVSPRYLDGKLFGASRRASTFAGTITAMTYPEVLDETDRLDGICYRVMTETKYQLHLVYNLLLEPTSVSRKYQEVASFAWNFTTRPRNLPGYRKTSHMVIEADVAHSQTLDAIEDVLYGTSSTSPTLPSPEGVLQIFEENSILQIIDHGDGNWTAIGPDSVISMIDPDTFQINYSTAIYLDPDTYTIHSL